MWMSECGTRKVRFALPSLRCFYFYRQSESWGRTELNMRQSLAPCTGLSRRAVISKSAGELVCGDTIISLPVKGLG